MTDFPPPSGPPTFDPSAPSAATPPSAAPGSTTGRIGPDSTPGGSGGSGSKLWILAVIAIAAAGVAAVTIGGSSDDNTNTQLESASSEVATPTTAAEGGVATSAPAESAAAETAPVESAPTESVPTSEVETETTVPPESEAVDGQTATVLIEGSLLDRMPGLAGPTSAENDTAVGVVAPMLTGVDFDGNPVTIAADGRPKAIYFVAHWCPHCQVEVPTIQGLVDAGLQPEGMDIYAVSTSVDPGSGNYPPQSWLEAEGWTSAVLVDDSNSSAVINYGAGGFPYAVYLDGENRVLTRTAGEMPGELTQQIWEAVAAS